MNRRSPVSRAGACALGAVFLATAFQAPAEEAPGCWWDGTSERFAAGDDDNYDYPAWSSPAGNKFAMTFVDHSDGNWDILYHCPSDNHLVVFSPTPQQSSINARFRQLLETTEPYTLTQISAELERLGARVTTGKGLVGRCPCEHLQSINALK